MRSNATNLEVALIVGGGLFLAGHMDVPAGDSNGRDAGERSGGKGSEGDEVHDEKQVELQ